MAALPVPEAAEALGIRKGTLRRWLRDGCPTAQRGRRGRGHAVLVDPDAVRQWRNSSSSDALLMSLAEELPEVLATATVKAWKQAQGVDKTKLAGIAAATWYTSANAVVDRLRERCPDVPELSKLPDEIETLRKIAQK